MASNGRSSSANGISADRLRRASGSEAGFFGSVKGVVSRPALGAAVALVLIYFFFAITAGGKGFLTAAGTASWFNTASYLGIISVPVGLLMIAGEFDLSIGSMVGAGSITTAIAVTSYNLSLVWALVACAVIATLVGLINAALVVLMRVPSFIATLATLLGVQALSLTVAKGVADTTNLPVSQSGGLSKIFTASWNQFTISDLWWLGIAAIAAWVLARTRLGNWIVATGGDTENARRAGVATARVKTLLFVATAWASALVGAMQAVQFSAGDATTGQGYVFEAPIVVVIGGVLLTGGMGTIAGVVLGTAIYGVASAGLFYTGWDTDLAGLVIGGLMVVAVLVRAMSHARYGKGGRL